MSYKFMMTERADEIADEEYEMEFGDLPVVIQNKIFNQAISDVHGRFIDEADNLRKAQMEGVI